jgi:cytochrome P450
MSGSKAVTDQKPQQHGLLTGLLPPELKRRGECPFDPPPALRDLDDRSPVSRVTAPGGQTVWVVTRFEEARTVLTDPRFSADRFKYGAAMAEVPEEARERAQAMSAGIFAAMDPPRHTRLRKLLTGQFTVRRMRELKPRIAEIVDMRIDAMISAGGTADLVTDFAFPVPSLVICELLGVPYSDHGSFQEWSSNMLRTDIPVERMREAGEQLQGYIRRLVREKTETPSDGLLSGLIHGDADPALTEDELVGIGMLLLFAGHETTANMLGLATFALLRNPGEMAALRENPDRIDEAVEELLRYLSIVQFGVSRVTVESTPLGGQVIPAGATVVLSIPMINRDSEQFDEPDSLDLSRPHRSHLAFGYGIHQCLGQQLARAEMTVALNALLRRLPGLRLAAAPEDIPLRTEMVNYGVAALPLTWDRPAGS